MCSGRTRGATFSTRSVRLRGRGVPDHPSFVDCYDLRHRCGLAPGAQVLEVGPGTGIVTRHLLSAGARVVAVEPDPSLASYLGDAHRR